MRNFLLSLGATGAVFAGLSITTDVAVAREQAPCDRVQFANNSDAWGTFVGTYNLKEAPAKECTTLSSGPQGARFYYWCYVYNEYGNQWIYGRIAGTTNHGWTSNENLRWEQGTLSPCPTT
ncbi:hypothetical protein OHR68_36540 [Spirillospora sp. NBC_00431]